jgi:hypothetical protein
MPSHFAHLLFAEEALPAALGEKGREILDGHGNLVRFAAQGPDFFYHNQRTMPTGLRYGTALHRHGYGTFVEGLAREALRLSLGPSSDLGAFILGFATHAPLDRLCHPFIGYFAGWDGPGQTAQHRRWHTHPFMERVLDLLLLRERFGKAPSELDFLSLVRCGKTLPYPVVKAFVKSLNATYPAYNYKSRDRIRVRNAYHDAIFFYKVTNHLNPDLLRLAFRKDRKEGFRERRLGLLHPREVPPGCDFMNLAHATWCHPCDDTSVYTASFLDLYEQALAVSLPMLKDLYAVLSGQAPLEGLGERFGNESLDTGRDQHCTPAHSQPLPLAQIIQGLYDAMEKQYPSSEG